MAITETFGFGSSLLVTDFMIVPTVVVSRLCKDLLQLGGPTADVTTATLQPGYFQPSGIPSGMPGPAVALPPSSIGLIPPSLPLQTSSFPSTVPPTQPFPAAVPSTLPSMLHAGSYPVAASLAGSYPPAAVPLHPASTGSSATMSTATTSAAMSQNHVSRYNRHFCHCPALLGHFSL